MKYPHPPTHTGGRLEKQIGEKVLGDIHTSYLHTTVISTQVPGASCPPQPPQCTAQPVLLRRPLPRGPPASRVGGGESGHVGRPVGRNPCAEGDGQGGILFLPQHLQAKRWHQTLLSACEASQQSARLSGQPPGRRRREGGAVGSGVPA